MAHVMPVTFTNHLIRLSPTVLQYSLGKERSYTHEEDGKASHLMHEAQREAGGDVIVVNLRSSDFLSAPSLSPLCT